MLASLPVKCAGFAIKKLVQTSQANSTARTLVCLHLLQAIQGTCEFFELNQTIYLLSLLHSFLGPNGHNMKGQ